MAQKPYKVHILGHSFVKRLKKDLEASFDTRADLRLRGTANVELFGVGGLTPDPLVANDLLVISRSSPDILVLETGTNDLAQSRPETVGSKIEELIKRLVDAFYVKIIAVCQVIPRGPSSDATFEAFNESARVLNGNHARTSLRFPSLRFLTFSSKHPLLRADEVHLNPWGQYKLWRTYRGAILAAISMF